MERRPNLLQRNATTARRQAFRKYLYLSMSFNPSGEGLATQIILLHSRRSSASTGVRFKVMSCSRPDGVYMYPFLCLPKLRRPCTSASGSIYKYLFGQRDVMCLFARYMYLSTRKSQSPPPRQISNTSYTTTFKRHLRTALFFQEVSICDVYFETTGNDDGA